MRPSIIILHTSLYPSGNQEVLLTCHFFSLSTLLLLSASHFTQNTCVRWRQIQFYALNSVHGSVEWPRQPCSKAKQLWLGYTPKTVYVQHAGLGPKQLQLQCGEWGFKNLDWVYKFRMPPFLSLWWHARESGQYNIFVGLREGERWCNRKAQKDRGKNKNWRESATNTTLFKFKPKLWGIETIWMIRICQKCLRVSLTDHGAWSRCYRAPLPASRHPLGSSSLPGKPSQWRTQGHSQCLFTPAHMQHAASICDIKNCTI